MDTRYGKEIYLFSQKVFPMSTAGLLFKIDFVIFRKYPQSRIVVVPYSDDVHFDSVLEFDSTTVESDIETKLEAMECFSLGKYMLNY